MQKELLDLLTHTLRQIEYRLEGVLPRGLERDDCHAIVAFASFGGRTCLFDVDHTDRSTGNEDTRITAPIPQDECVEWVTICRASTRNESPVEGEHEPGREGA